MILREPNFLTTTPTYWPRGVECILDYDNSTCVMNDLRRLDRIVVTEIGGLDGPELNATAEKNPDRDGEEPQDATYGGRTITLRGYVEAGNLDKLRQMRSYLLDAFDDPTEAPLWFRYLDWRDPFTDSLALVDYAYDAGSGTVSIASDGSGLQPTSTANKILRVLPAKSDGTSPSRFTYGDGEAIVRFRNGTAMTSTAVGPEFRRSSSVRKLRVIYEKATDTLRLYKVDTSTTQLATVAATTLAINTDYWIRVRVEGAVITFSLWSVYPPDMGTTGQLATQTHTLSGGDQALYPASTSGLGWGLYWTPNSTTDRVKLLDVGAINPGDAIVNCRKATMVEGNEAQVDYQWRRDFMLTLRASDSRMVSRKLTTVSTSPPTPALVQEYLSLSATNLGRSPAAMTIVFDSVGTSFGLGSPKLLEPTTLKRVGLSKDLGGIDDFGVIASSATLNSDDRTVVDQIGNPIYSILSNDTTWPELPRGANTLRVTSERFSSFESATIGSNLNALLFWNAETWATSGSTTDYVFAQISTPADQLPTDRFLYARRTTTADAGNGRIALAGTTNYTDATARLQIKFSTIPSSTITTNEFGLVLRYVDANNYFRVGIRFITGSAQISSFKKVAGVDTQELGDLPLHVSLGTQLVANTWYELETTVRSDGRWRTRFLNAQTGSLIFSDDQFLGKDFETTPTSSWNHTDSALATGGALATGRIGMIDRNNIGSALTRDVAMLAIRSAMIGGRVDVMYRHSSR